MRRKGNRVLGLAALLFLGLVASKTAQAMPPPVEVALKATADQVQARRERSWKLTLAEPSLRTLEGEWAEGGEALRFEGAGEAIVLGEASDGVWRLMWAMLWSVKPEELLEGKRGEFARETGRVEIVNGEPAYCYGRRERLCVDGAVRAVLVVQVEIDGVQWELRRERRGEGVQISRSGALFARLSGM